MSAIKAFAKEHNIPMTAVITHPSYDEKKGRVTKGASKANKGWKDKGCYEAINTTQVITADEIEEHPTAWLLHIKPLLFYVIDVDVKNGKTFKDVMKKDILEGLLKDHPYMVETGSGGVHLYYSYPPLAEGETITKKVDCTELNEAFIRETERENASVDIITDSILCEGSSYTFEGETYSYTAVKQGSSIHHVEFHVESWEGMIKRLCVHSMEAAKPLNTASSDEALHAVLMGMSKARADTYQDWRNVGMALHNDEHDVSLWIEFSKRSNKFRFGECGRVWRGFQKKEKGYTTRTLWYMLKQDDPALFNKLWKESTTRRDLLINSLTGGQFFLAEYYVSCNLDDYLYDQHSGWWYLQDNNTWTNCGRSYPTTLNARISRTLYKAYNELRMEFRAKALEGNKDAEFYAGLLKSVLRMEADVTKSGFIKGVMEFCASLYAELTQPLLDKFGVDEKEGVCSFMDINPMLFAFKNCVYDFNSKETRPIKPHDFLSMTCGYNYPTRSEKAIREVEETLKTIWSRQGEYGDDGETYEAVMRLMATGLCGKKWLEAFVLLTGSGRNGKGLLNELLTHMFGNYYYAAPSQLLTKTPESATCADPTTFGLKAKRMTVMSEPEATEKLQEGRYKWLTGSDPITARPLYGGNATFAIQCLLMMQCNNIPLVNGMTKGGQMRLIVVPFPFEFNANPRSNREKLSNPHIKNDMCKSEEWRSAMWFILLDRFEEVRGKGHGQIPLSALIDDRTAEYVQENNAVGEWWKEHYEKDEKGQLLSRDVWSAYKVDTGDYAMGDKKFKQAMGFNLIDMKRIKGGPNRDKMGIVGWKRKEE